MRRVAILYNPRSGRASSRRRAEVEIAAAVLRVHGLEVGLQPTAGARSADQQARQFIAAGFDTIVASGGDGTVHDVLQGVVGTDAALAVLPLGTANSLACDLGLATDPAKTAEQMMSATMRRIAVGEIEYERNEVGESRYFTVAAGVGADAALFYDLNARSKQRWGMAAYVAASLRQWVIQKFPRFEVEWVDSETKEKHTDVVTQLLAVRIANFGGVLKELAPGADLRRSDLRLVLFKTASHVRYLRFATGRLVGRAWHDPHIELAHATEVSCCPHKESGGGPRIYAEADGELLGRLPVKIGILPNALNLLMPNG